MLPPWSQIVSLIPIELYKQPNETNKNYFCRLVISSIRAAGVAKTDDEVYVSSIIKMYCYFSLVFSTVPKKVPFLKTPFTPYPGLIEESDMQELQQPLWKTKVWCKENVWVSREKWTHVVTTTHSGTRISSQITPK